MTDVIPSYLQTMRDITGTLEEPGDNDNPVILAWADEIATRYPEMKLYCAQYTHDSIPWCGLTVGYVMAHNGIKPQYGATDTDKFLWAQSWKQFGSPREGDPQLGDILVFSGHVSMYDGRNGDYYLCRGGNQSDQVKVSSYHKDTVQAVRVPPAGSIGPIVIHKPVTKINSKKPTFTGITATEFGGVADPNTSAYDGHEIDDEEFGVALPYRFTGTRPKVRVFHGDKSVDCNIVDVGPWNTNDPYWEKNARPQAESGTDMSGRTTNHAGIDLTPAAAEALGINGMGKVDWMFITAPANKPTKEEQVVRQSSKKMRAFDSIRTWLKALFGVTAATASADNFGLFNAWMGLGNGAIPITTLLAIGVAGAVIYLLVNTFDKWSMEDFKAGRWMPSELAKDNPVVPNESK